MADIMRKVKELDKSIFKRIVNLGSRDDLEAHEKSKQK